MSSNSASGDGALLSRFCGFGIFGVSALVLAWPAASWDLWWHLAWGREIARSWSIPRADIFSWTLSGKDWVDFEWLYQLFLYGLQAAGGSSAVVWGNAVLGALAVWAVWRMTLLHAESEASGAGGAFGAAFLAAACALVLVRTRNFCRPEMLSLVLVPVFLHAALRWRREGKVGALVALPLWIVLWANSHGGFVLGLAVLGLAALGSFFEACAQGASSERFRSAKGLVLCLAACSAAALLNPYGWRAYQVVLEHSREIGSLGRGAIAEWRSLRLGEYPVYWALLAASFGLLARDLLLRRAQAYFWAPLILGFGFWSSQQVRAPVYLALAAGPYVFGRGFRQERRKGSLFAPGVLMGLAGLGLLSCCLWPVFGRDFRRAVRWEVFPVGAADFLERHAVQGPMLNECAFGGYLEWRFGRIRPVSCDSRYLFHAAMADWADRASRPGALSAYIEGTGTDYALMAHGTAMESRAGGRPIERSPWPSLFPRKHWALVYWDDAALVFMRRGRGQDKVIAEHEYRTADPDDAEFIAEQARGDRRLRARVLAELSRQEKESVYSARRAWLQKNLENP
ncbi:MAG: hypothetical protein WCU88_05245 [Elusimicrobiota bacterium]|jgi:hypothetical protein